MASLTDETDLATTAVGSSAAPSSLPGFVDTEVPGNWALDGEDWTAAAIDPLVPASLEALDLATVLHALSDPVRLRIVHQLSDGGERTCGSFELPVGKSTCSHHFRVLREAGVVAQRVDGKCRFNRLRTDELERRFPGLLGAVLQAKQQS